MIAAKTPAASSPARTFGACRPIIRISTALAAGPSRPGMSAAPITPSRTLGSQTTATHSG